MRFIFARWTISIAPQKCTSFCLNICHYFAIGSVSGPFDLKSPKIWTLPRIWFHFGSEGGFKRINFISKNINYSFVRPCTDRFFQGLFKNLSIFVPNFATLSIIGSVTATLSIDISSKFCWLFHIGAMKMCNILNEKIPHSES